MGTGVMLEFWEKLGCFLTFPGVKMESGVMLGFGKVELGCFFIFPESKKGTGMKMAWK